MSYARNQTIIKVDKLCVSYDRPILRDVSFEVRNVVRPGVQQGQVVSIIGRSGIGKSQLFRCLSGLMRPTSGEVLIGEPLHRVQPGQVGVVPQNYVLLRHRTVEKNLMLATSYRPTTKAQRDIVDTIMQEHARYFDITDHLKKYPHELSGGQRQRVSILQQILTGNRTILLDEPFSGLDAPMIEKVLDLLRRVSLLHEMQTLVIVSHDIESALAISDEAFVLGLSYTASDAQDDTMVPILGATITHHIDLAERELAFDAGVRDKPAFRETVREVKSYL